MLMHTMAAQVRRFAGCRRGVPAIEAALIIPIFFLMSLALTEIARYALTVRTVARVAALQAAGA